MALAGLALKPADYTNVSNPNLVKNVATKGGKAIVIPDPLPDFTEIPRNAAVEKHPSDVTNVLFIFSWADDEP